MFTIADICDIAIQIEHNGETTYRKAAKTIGDTTMSDILSRMADDERQHAIWFGQLADEHAKADVKDEIEAMGRTLLKDMVKGETFSLDAEQLRKAENLAEFFDLSISFEQDTVMFYEMLNGFVDDSVKSQLSLVIEQEKDHIHKIESMVASYLQHEA